MKKKLAKKPKAIKVVVKPIPKPKQKKIEVCRAAKSRKAKSV
jgi:hypothetical protein